MRIEATLRILLTALLMLAPLQVTAASHSEAPRITAVRSELATRRVELSARRAELAVHLGHAEASDAERAEIAAAQAAADELLRMLQQGRLDRARAETLHAQVAAAALATAAIPYVGPVIAAIQAVVAAIVRLIAELEAKALEQKAAEKEQEAEDKEIGARDRPEARAAETQDTGGTRPLPAARKIPKP